MSPDADVQLVNRKGDSALHQAAMNGHTDIIKALLEKGESFNIHCILCFMAGLAGVFLKLIFVTVLL